jgi:hypothetical protein
MSRQAQFHDLTEMMELFNFNINIKEHRDMVESYVQENSVPLGDIIYCDGEGKFVIVGENGRVFGADIACSLPFDRRVLGALQEGQVKYDDLLELMKKKDDIDDWFYLFYWDECDAAEQAAEDYRKHGLIST